jgi:hypothetical protein
LLFEAPACAVLAFIPTPIPSRNENENGKPKLKTLNENRFRSRCSFSFVVLVEVPTRFRNIETRARGSSKRLIAELRIGNLRLANNDHQLASDLMSEQRERATRTVFVLVFRFR